METRELEEMERFFASLGHRTPLAYYGLPEDAAPEAIDSAVKKRRTWAQGQQANPKHRSEALYLIKSNASLRKLLIDERDMYSARFSLERNESATEPEPASGVAPGGDIALLGGSDVYQLLEVPHTASSEVLEAGYRNRYRWARSLKDSEKSSAALAALDAAWRLVRDAPSRAAYDAQRGVHGQAAPAEAAAESRHIAELLLRNSEIASPPPLATPVRPPPLPVARPAAVLPEGPSLRFAPEQGAPVATMFGRTIGLGVGAQTVGERAPKLVLGVKSAVRLHLPRTRRVAWVLHVENSGAGRMSGHLVADVPWIVPSREHLDPLAREQDIVIDLVPTELDAKSGVGILTVVTDHGERRIVHFEVTRAGRLGLVVGGLVFAASLVAGAFGWQHWQDSHAPPERAVLHLSVKPPAERIVVNGSDMGGGSTLDIDPPTRGQPFKVVISAAGFVEYQTMVTVADQPLTLSVALKPVKR